MATATHAKQVRVTKSVRASRAPDARLIHPLGDRVVGTSGATARSRERVTDPEPHVAGDPRDLAGRARQALAIASVA